MKTLGPYPLHTESSWIPDWDPDHVQDMVDPNIWSDDSMESIPHLDFEVAGAFFFLHMLQPNNQW